MAKIYSVKGDSVKVENTTRAKRNVTGFPVIKENGNVVTIDLSNRLIWIIVLALSFVFFSNQLFTILMFLFVGFVLMSSMRPIVGWFVKKGLSLGWSVFVSYLLFVLIFFGVLSLIFVPFLNQSAELVETLPLWIENALGFLKKFSFGGFSFDVAMINTYVKDFLTSVPTADNFKNIADFVSGFVSLTAMGITCIIFSIYLILEHDHFFDIVLIRITSDETRERVKKLLSDVERKLGGWVLGQATVSTLAALFSGTVLTILNVPFAIPLAIFVGLMGLIPNVGATLAGLAMSFVAIVTVGPIKALIVLAIFLLYQPLENSVITPRVMGSAVGLKPVVILLGVIASLILLGAVGGLIAVPLMVIVKIFYEFYIDLQKLKAKGIV